MCNGFTFPQVSIKMTAGIYYHTYVARDASVFAGVKKVPSTSHAPPAINQYRYL